MLLRVLRLEKLALAVAAALCAAWLTHSGLVWRLDHLIYDWIVRVWTPPASDDIVIVAIDQRSLNELGSWPWSRRTHAELLDRLRIAGPATMALDLILSHANPSDPGGDEILIEAVKQSGEVVLPVAYGQTDLGGQLTEILPLTELAGAAAALGHVDVPLDQDGVARRVFLKAGLGSTHWPSLPLAVLKQVHEVADPLPGSVNGIAQASPYMWLRDHHVMVRFAGPPGTYQQVSYVDVLRHEIGPDVLRGRLVLIGATAGGLGAELVTPVTDAGRPMSGVEFNANVLDTLLREDAIEGLGPIWLVGLSAGAAFGPLLLFTVVSTRWALPAAMALMLLPVAASAMLLHGFDLWFQPAAALLAIGVGCACYSWLQLRQALSFQRSLTEAQERALVTLHSVDNGVVITDASGRVQDLNPSAQRLTGFDVSEARGRQLVDVLNFLSEPDRQPQSLPEPTALVHAITRLPGPSLLIDRAGHEAVIRCSAAPIRSEGGQTLGMVLAIADVTEARRLSDQMTYQATHDLLTGLPNRNLLHDRLQHAIAAARRTDRLIGVLFVDLDRFKVVNDGLGHHAGDAVLEQAATRLRQRLREADTVARLGGDEFAIVLENVADLESVLAVADDILAQFRQPFRVETHELLITCSVGIAMFPQHGQDPDELLKNADGAMYEAKRLGRDNVQCHVRGVDRRARDQLLLAQRLRRAIEQGELALHYQPQIDLVSGRIIGAEALVRWHHPDRGLLRPDVFVPLAEASGLIMFLDDWVIEAVQAQVRAWQQSGLPDIRIALNLSPTQLARTDIGWMIAQMVRLSGVAPCHLELEITERTIVQDLDRVRTNLQQLKGVGVMLAIDDFGTGYSSLSYLSTLPVDRLKIDRSFIKAVPSDPNNATLVGAMVSMANSLGLSVVAEGVETIEQLDFLRARGCEAAQGYLICEPKPAAEMTRILFDRQPLLRLP